MANTYVHFTGVGSEKVLATYWEAVSSASGAITFPAGSTFVTNSFQDLEGAIVSRITGGVPNFNAASDSGGARCVATLDGAGSYSISPVPSAYPVALLFRVLIPIVYYDPTNQNVIAEDVERAGSLGAVDSVNSITGPVTIAAGSGISVTQVSSTITVAATGGASSNSYFPGGWG